MGIPMKWMRTRGIPTRMNMNPSTAILMLNTITIMDIPMMTMNILTTIKRVMTTIIAPTVPSRK